jgi:hypothetical protein
MKRTDAIQFHTEEAADARRLAAQDTTTPAHTELLASARDHEVFADAARTYDYPGDLED